MRRLITILLILLLLMIYVKAKADSPIKVAVIDTGLGTGYSGSAISTKHLCKSEHIAFGSDQSYVKYDETFVPTDKHGHGTNIAGIIEKNLQNENYCLVIIKYWDPTSPENNDQNSLKAIAYAAKIHADIINYSGGGPTYDKEEASLVKAYLDQGGIFMAAAGNENSDLDKNPFYPAMDDSRVKVVGNLGQDGNRSVKSNYGKRVDFWEMGENVEGNGIVLTGTSQATAIETAKFVHKIWATRNAK